VVCPLPIHRWWKERSAGKAPAPARRDSGEITVLRPCYLSLSARQLGPVNTAVATQALFERAVRRAVARLDVPPDAVYGHFLYPAGAAAVRAGRRLGIPSFVAVGESSFWSTRAVGLERARRDYQHVSGVVAVSSLLRRELIARLGISEEKIRVFPNGVALDRFFPRDRQAMRKKFDLPADRFLVAKGCCASPAQSRGWRASP